MFVDTTCSSSSSQWLHSPASDHQPLKSRYTIYHELGSGLHGRVLLAYDHLVHRDVAIKVPAGFPPVSPRSGITKCPPDQELQHQVSSLIHEFHAMACIQHPNVLQVDHLVTRSSNYVALVTEFAPNGDLFDLLETSGALPEPLGKVYTCQLLRALAACHANGVVHRDVKPENLLLDATYQLKLADFGVGATAPLGMQVHDLMLRDESGTALYMAPEVKSSQGFYRGPPVDVWSAGIVLFILLTGLPPFDRAERGDVSYDALLARDFASFWKSQPDQVLWTVSAGARHLITSMLRAPNERITVTEALQHSWLRGGADQVDSDWIHQAVLTHLEAARTAKNASPS